MCVCQYNECAYRLEDMTVDYMVEGLTVHDIMTCYSLSLDFSIITCDFELYQSRYTICWYC